MKNEQSKPGYLKKDGVENEYGIWNINYFEIIDSTQKYLLNKIEKKDLNYYCVWSEIQTNGIGTKNKKWIGKKGNLFFSFAVNLNEFNFVPMQSLSVYFSYLMYKVLIKYKKNLTIKWPNDIYLLENRPKKIAGILTNIKKNKIVCGIGVNTKINPNIAYEYESGCLDIDIKNDKILKDFLKQVLAKPGWEDIIKDYKCIFNKSKHIFYIDAEINNDATLKGK